MRRSEPYAAVGSGHAHAGGATAAQRLPYDTSKSIRCTVSQLGPGEVLPTRLHDLQALICAERRAEAAHEKAARLVARERQLRSAYKDIQSIMAALPPPTPRSAPREGTPPAPWYVNSLYKPDPRHDVPR